MQNVFQHLTDSKSWLNEILKKSCSMNIVLGSVDQHSWNRWDRTDQRIQKLRGPFTVMHTCMGPRWEASGQKKRGEMARKGIDAGCRIAHAV